MTIQNNALGGKPLLHANKRGTALSKKEKAIIDFTIRTLGQQIDTYWTQDEWRLCRSFNTWSLSPDVFDPLCSVFVHESKDYNPKMIKSMEIFLKRQGYLLEKEKDFFQVKIEAEKCNLNKHKWLPCPKEILKNKRKHKKQILEKIHSIVIKIIQENKSDRYDLTFVGFNPNLLQDYKDQYLSVENGFKVKPLKTKWMKKLVKVSKDDTVIVYRPHTVLSLLAQDLTCFSLRSKIKYLTSRYKKTIYF